jgi:hypothetical protein
MRLQKHSARVQSNVVENGFHSWFRGSAARLTATRKMATSHTQALQKCMKNVVAHGGFEQYRSSNGLRSPVLDRVNGRITVTGIK